jgi:hypothetical protein
VTGGGNSLSVRTATGKILSPAEYPKHRIGNIPEGVAHFRRLPEAERKPKSWAPQGPDNDRKPPPEGFLVCRVYMRGFNRDARGQLHRKEELTRQYAGPNRDFLWLTGAEWKSLLPSKPKQGAKHAVPGPVADRLFRFYLNDRTKGLMGGFWEPGQFRGGQLSLTVEEVSSTAVRLRLDGSARLTDAADLSAALRKSEFRFLGYLNYDTRKKGFDRFDVVALGDHYDSRPIAREERYKHYYDPSGRITLGVAFELATPGSLGYGTPPLAICMGDPPQLRDYFGTDQHAGVRRYFAKDR